ncbi:MAG: D-alanyl-D-alanine carboxypeptidase [Rhizobiales bacterium]|nr:D-alanyl-D-alanine carboxypeptidase [Hyphomicrobiales bacterium]
MTVGLPLAAAAAPQSAIVVDGKTGKVLYSQDPDGLRHPASLTKMMTLYLLFEALDSGRFTLSSQLKVSQFASRQAPTKLGLKPGSTIAVKDAMLGLITRSANDAAVVIAENISGSEAAFANKMTRTARSIGMSRTTFRNASGLPNPNQWTTARDMATLGRALQARYPSYYRYFATKSFVYKGRAIGNHNKLLGRVEGVDGIKTGYTRASGFNLVSSVKRDNRYIVATVMGGSSGASRDRQMVGLIGKYMPVAYAGNDKGAGNSLFAKLMPKAKPAPAPAPAAPAEDDAPAAAAAPDDTIETASLVPAPRNRPGPQARAVQTQDIAPTDDMAEISYAEQPAAPTAAAGPRMVFQQGPSGKAAGGKPVARPAVMAASAAGVADDPTEEGEQGRVLSQGDADDSTPNTLPRVGTAGWKVQIAATDSEDGARSLLDKARAKGGKLLASATFAIEPVEKGGGTFYRARFVGFDNKNEARAACDYLKKRSVNCLAISD